MTTQLFSFILFDRWSYAKDKRSMESWGYDLLRVIEFLRAGIRLDFLCIMYSDFFDSSDSTGDKGGDVRL